MQSGLWVPRDGIATMIILVVILVGAKNPLFEALDS